MKTNQSNFKVRNVFGITPKKSYQAAGWDFFIPDIKPDKYTKEEIFKYFAKSYKTTEEKIENHFNRFEKVLLSYGKQFLFERHKYNLLHLFLGLDGSIMRSSQNKVLTFLTYYLEETNDIEKIGINLRCNDHILINSGIKVGLEPGTVGIFFNKSGKGTKGLDTRACVVDEDYTGFVHLSLAYTKDNAKDGKIMIGDKITQMVILPVIQYSDCEELSEDEYNNLMDGSERGDGAMGSTDNK